MSQLASDGHFISSSSLPPPEAIKLMYTAFQTLGKDLPKLHSTPGQNSLGEGLGPTVSL